ncbi:MAG: FtsX-like permease family protein [Streptococcus salivarius]|uniref:ABC transporter permease n=1 Tax=Streptococcus salivarius TaxID=1304 RepID=A0A1R3TBJ1_STRSL|nr:ABC transporter permease [Streptococcus salivarius]SCW20769.1 hypothetical protein [Streptococcus salivarius]
MFSGRCIFFKRSLRRIRKNIVKLLSIFLLVFITTALFVGYYVGTSSVLSSITEFNKTNNLESGHFMTNQSLSKNNPDIEKIEYAEISTKDTTIRVFKKSQFINLYQITEGKDNNDINDILIDNNYLLAHGLRINDSLKLLGNNFNISGVAISPDYIMSKKNDLILQPNSETFGVAYVSEATFDKYFKNRSHSYYSYTGNKTVKKLAKQFNVLSIIDSKNDSKVKQVIGDAESPKKLSLVIVSLFLIITIILISIYFIEVKRREHANIESLYNLGKSKIWLMSHYMFDVMIIVNSAWLSGVISGLSVIKIVMYMNSSIYNYPILTIDKLSLYSAIFGSLIVLNFLLLVMSYVNFYIQKHKVSLTKKNITNCLPSFSFTYRYRIVKMIRNYWETILYFMMIFITAILINFSILLKSSVSDYVENLRHETKFEFMYNVQSDQETYPDTEMLRNYRLSDDNGILQTVYLLNANSKYYDIRNDDVVVTKAFSEKYNYKVGDKIKLSDRVSNKDLYFKIDRISNNNTNSEVYINNTLIEELEGINSFNTIVLSNKRLKDSQNIISVITKNEIVKSGKNILNIINKQISMILVIAIVVEITLMYSLIRFIYENNYSSMKVYYLLGFSKKDIYRFHFSLNIPISIVLIASGYALNLIIVRKFLDNIMYTFSNYVVVSNNIHSFAVTTLLIFIVYLLFILSFRIKLQKEDFK